MVLWRAVVCVAALAGSLVAGSTECQQDVQSLLGTAELDDAATAYYAGMNFTAVSSEDVRGARGLREWAWEPEAAEGACGPREWAGAWLRGAAGRLWGGAALVGWGDASGVWGRGRRLAGSSGGTITTRTSSRKNYEAICMALGAGVCSYVSAEVRWQTWVNGSAENGTWHSVEGMIDACIPLSCCNNVCDLSSSGLAADMETRLGGVLARLCGNGNGTARGDDDGNYWCAGAGTTTVSVTTACQVPEYFSIFMLMGFGVVVCCVLGVCVAGSFRLGGRNARWDEDDDAADDLRGDRRMPFLLAEAQRRLGEERIEALVVFRFGEPEPPESLALARKGEDGSGSGSGSGSGGGGGGGSGGSAGGSNGEDGTVAVDSEGAGELPETPTCPITLEELSPGDVVARFSPCGHLFRADALRSWLVTRDTCPVCRARWDYGMSEAELRQAVTVRAQAALEQLQQQQSQPQIVVAMPPSAGPHATGVVSAPPAASAQQTRRAAGARDDALRDGVDLIDSPVTAPSDVGAPGASAAILTNARAPPASPGATQSASILRE
jgi:Ring finger domain